jgi:hypothetical protein
MEVLAKCAFNQQGANAPQKDAPRTPSYRAASSVLQQSPRRSAGVFLA